MKEKIKDKVQLLKILGWIASTVAGAWIGDVLSKVTPIGRGVIIATGITAAILYAVILFGFQKRRKVSYEKLENFLANESLCTIYDQDKTFLRNDINSSHKARCIYQIRFKHHINWIDTIYWGYMGELAELGVDCIVLIHDTEFYKQNSSIHTAEAKKHKYNLELMIKWIKKISSNKVRIVLASEYYKSSRHNSNFINVLYNSFLPFLVNNSEQLFGDTEERVIHNIRYILGLCMLCNMKYDGALLSIIWSGRQNVFEQFVSDYSNYIGNSVHTILCKTYYEKDKSTPKLTINESELYFDGSETKIKKLIKKMDKEALEDIRRYTFHDKNARNISIDELRDLVCKKIVEYQKQINGVEYDE